MVRPTRVRLVNLARIAYGLAVDLQNELVARRQAGEIDDVLLLLEHEPVITLGRRADESHVLATREALCSAGITVHHTERGGDVTYHGPGQLVGYPILHLPSHNLGASDYMHLLEEVVVRTAADYDLTTQRREGVIGVWVGINKLAAFGVRIKRGVSMHGLALNVDPDMDHWRMIIPCGIRDGFVTSLSRELGVAPPMDQVRRSLAEHFAALFGVELFTATLGELGCAQTREASAMPSPNQGAITPT